VTRQILFIGHSAGRTGAPIVLLHLLRWLKVHTNISFQILLREGGELEPEFKALAPVWVLNRKGIVRKATRCLGLELMADRLYLTSLKRRLQKEEIALIYSNTITNSKVLEFLSDKGTPIICHVHELESWIRYGIGLAQFNSLKERVTHYIAASEAVKSNLVQNHGISEERIDVIHEFIPTQLNSAIIRPESQSRIRKQLGIPPEALIVGACGSTIWRKGPDLFIQLARTVYQRQPDTRVDFVWVGGENAGPRFGELWHDVSLLGLEKYIHFLGDRPNPLDYFAAFDLFALVSREDPYPLVMLEAASVGKPVVCFDRAGGAKEFVEDDCGFVVPYLDLETMATQVLALCKDTKLRQRLGQRAMQKVRARHDVAHSASKIADIIERTCW